jgi:hypothetical protein
MQLLQSSLQQNPRTNDIFFLHGLLSNHALRFHFYLLTIINSNKDQFVDHLPTIKILVKFYLPQAAQVTILR